jgi:hypothetical protein
MIGVDNSWPLYVLTAAAAETALGAQRQGISPSNARCLALCRLQEQQPAVDGMEPAYSKVEGVVMKSQTPHKVQPRASLGVLGRRVL